MRQNSRWHTRFLPAILSVVCASIVVATLYAFLSPSRQAVNSKADPIYLNSAILEQIQEYSPRDEFAPLPSELVASTMGATQDIYYLGERRIVGDSHRRSYCIGLIFEVYMKACEKYAGGANAYHLPTVTSDSFKQFRRDFYGVDGNKKTFVRTLSERGLGTEITVDEAMPGDLIQFWRSNGTGHAVVFKELEKDREGRPTALHYFSVQSMTGGISDHVESFRKDIVLASTFVVRPHAPLLGPP